MNNTFKLAYYTQNSMGCCSIDPVFVKRNSWRCGRGHSTNTNCNHVLYT